MVNTSEIAAVLSRATKTGQVPGLVAAVATLDGVVFEGAYGTRNIATGEPMTMDTVMWIASMTKAITAVCAMQLVERGVLSLDESLKSLVPRLKNLQVLEGFGSDGRPKLRPAKRELTLRHLLTHTSGYVYNLWNADMARFMEATETPDVLYSKLATLSIPLMADPGEQWEYGISLEWAGQVVEAASGKKLGNYMRENIFDPLGMKDAGFKIGSDQRQRLGKIHSRTQKGFLATDIEIPQEPEFEIGGGGLYSTIGDYLKFLRMILGGGAVDGVRLLKPETVAMMSVNAMKDIVCRPLRTTNPAFSNDVEFVAGMKWGLSFLINERELPTGRSPGSLAWAGLANSYFWIDPVKKITGVYSAQLFPFYDHEAVKTFEAFERAVYRVF